MKKKTKLTTKEKVGIGVGIAAVGVFIYFLAKKENGVPNGDGIQLYEGSNILTYGGPHQTNANAFSSIRQYILIVYRLETIYGVDTWVQIDPDSDRTLMTGITLALIVSQDCLWTF